MVSKLGRLSGRRLMVPASLVASRIIVEVANSDADDHYVELTVRGSIMESAKVFRVLESHIDGQVVRLTVFASLVFWNRSGSPDFVVTQRLALDPGSYRVVYADAGGDTLIREVRVGNGSSNPT